MTSNISVNSNLQSGGIAAGVINFGRSVRHLDQHLENQLKANLSKNDKIIVTAVMGDQEAFMFAREIVEYLKKVGYEVQGVNQAIYAQPITKQRIYKNDNKVDIIIGENV